MKAITAAQLGAGVTVVLRAHTIAYERAIAHGTTDEQWSALGAETVLRYTLDELDEAREELHGEGVVP